MQKLDTFQKNTIRTGTHLVAELPAPSSDVRAFIVIGAYVQTPSGRTQASKILNKEQPDLRFWLYKYEVGKDDLESGYEVSEKQLINVIERDPLQSIEELETDLALYLQDFSLLKAPWKFDIPLPFF